MPRECEKWYVQLEKYFDFSLYSHHFSLLSLTSLLSAPEREVTSPSDFKVVGALITVIYMKDWIPYLKSLWNWIKNKSDTILRQVQHQVHLKWILKFIGKLSYNGYYHKVDGLTAISIYYCESCDLM